MPAELTGGTQPCVLSVYTTLRSIALLRVVITMNNYQNWAGCFCCVVS